MTFYAVCITDLFKVEVYSISGAKISPEDFVSDQITEVTSLVHHPTKKDSLLAGGRGYLATLSINPTA